MSLSTYGPLLLAVISALLIIGGVYMTVRDMRSKRTLTANASPAPMAETTRTVTEPVTSRRMPPPPAPPPPIPSPPIQRRPQPTQPVTRPAPVENDAARYAESNADVTIVRRDAKAATHAPPMAPTSAFVQLQAAIKSIVSEADPEKSDHGADGQRWPSVETRWLQVDHVIAHAVRRLNTTFESIKLSIGDAGETNWSFKNRGFGCHRRIEIDGKSVAWLRSDINQEQVLTLKVRAHEPQMLMLNATTEVAASTLDATAVLDALSRVIRHSAEFAAWSAQRQRPATEQDRSGWNDIARTASDAFVIAKGALKEVGATVTEKQKPSWEPEAGRFRWILSVAVKQTPAADVTVDLIRRQIEIASHVHDQRHGNLARKRRLDVEGLDAHAFAEAIAACAWPSVATMLEQTNASESQ